ncbi:2'-5' RNA ligase family protein [Brevundimonas sp.]|uniref:2'-5' RNA ligase family protein n=1 Tax=Brevundimonas sp. TaxID=1871086 RepID=UPI00286D3000|nr:2'-5' RNA ligase family protein [Brevundimonas sp.]
MTGDADPLILSLGFDGASFARFDGLRRTHFPAAFNRIPAHLTLFHHLPGDRLAEVAAAVLAAAGAIAPFDIHVTGLRKLGRGVALALESADLASVRARLAARFADALTPQDRQGFRPHVTIQNKVEPGEALALHDRLAVDFTPWTARAEALLLWRYRGGPWEAENRFEFRSGA